MEVTTKLLDEEARVAAEHREAIGKVTRQVEALFLLHDLTMGDILEIFGLFTSRANKVFEDTKIKSIKETYERNQ